MKRSIWPAAFTVLLGLLLMVGSTWASPASIESPVVNLQTTPTPTPVRNYLPWVPHDATPTPSPAPTATPIPAGWVAQYFNNPTLSGSPVLTRVDSQIDFDFGNGSPDASIQADGFSARWVRTLTLPAGDYNFFTYADDGVRLWIDDVLVIDEWHGGDATQYLSARPLSAGQHTIKMEYYEDIGRAVARLGMVNTTAYPQPQPFEWGSWQGEYYDNRNLTGEPRLVRKDNNISFEWGEGSPDPSIPTDNFSVRWTASLFLQGGDYDFFAIVDDGVRLWVDGALVIDHWQDSPPTVLRSFLPLSTGVHFIRMEYYEATAGATAQLWWHNSTSYPAWRGEYFANMDLSGSPAVVRNDASIDFDWPGSPADGVPHDGFSVRWTRSIFLEQGDYTFTAFADDGVRLWVDEVRALDEWHDGAQEYVSFIPLESGVHFLRMEYYQNSFGARARLTVTKN